MDVFTCLKKLPDVTGWTKWLTGTWNQPIKFKSEWFFIHTKYNDIDVYLRFRSRIQ